MIAARTVARAQVTLSVVFLSGYFFVLSLFLTGKVSPPETWRDVLISLISVLTAGVLTIVHFWFSRSRSTGEPEKGGVQG